MKYVPNHPNTDDLFPHYKIPDIEFPKHEGEKSLYELIESQSAYLEKTSKELHDMAESAKSQAESAKEIAESSKVQANTALKTSSKADIKGWISVIVAIACAFMEFAVHHSEIIEFVKTLVK
jgi:methyl-accepting chemotaxis protein|nr:MAG TPA: hypothetical protein [Bacteriophage sp.]